MKTLDDLKPHELKALAKYALLVSVESPDRPATYSVKCMVSWNLINDIRMMEYELGLAPFVHKSRLLYKKMKKGNY